MKILFINISDVVGGAAIAARRLGKGLEKYFDTENTFLVRNKMSSEANVFPTRRNKFEQVTERWVNIFMNLAGLQYQYLPFSPKFILQKARQIRPDIISLHNTLGGYFATPMLIPLSKIAPVVWTLHDMWAFTGNSAHTFGDESWKEMKNSRANTKIFPSIGINTGSLLLRQKKRIYKESDLTIVAPSIWLYDLARQSPVFEGKEMHQIYHGLDEKVFFPHNKAAIRQRLDIPADAKVLMFSAEKLKGNPYKGGQDLRGILSEINSRLKEKIHLIILGSGSMEELNKFENFIIHWVGYVSEEKSIAEFLSASDLFIYPTRADILSIALAEAISCGVPAITFDLGGGPTEVVVDKLSGFLVKPFDLKEFADKTLSILYDKKRLSELSQSARDYALKKFSLMEMSQKYYDLFLRLKNRS
ncbi:MAG: glycosyltransferase [Ignavibacteria bacterium]|nr:glycosyltransferase [Ignavibacteria bacterium]MCU7503336.1 glycosyltransferase [Ignavibacteria bacterium]MCU7515718.1 glycosyltransferase [Ignavibacteria bacterium]